LYKGEQYGKILLSIKISIHFLNIIRSLLYRNVYASLIR